jgi:NAD(P)H-dependent FMN reductase
LTRRLTDIAYTYAKSKYDDAEYLDLRKTRIASFEGLDLEYDETTKKAIKLVRDSDVLILGSPVYDGLLSSTLKNLFEHINYKLLEGKIAGFILKSNGYISFLQVQGQLTAMMTYFRIISNPRAVFVTDDDFEDTKLKNEKVKKRIEDLVDDTVNMSCKPK